MWMLSNQQTQLTHQSWGMRCRSTWQYMAYHDYSGMDLQSVNPSSFLSISNPVVTQNNLFLSYEQVLALIGNLHLLRYDDSNQQSLLHGHSIYALYCAPSCGVCRAHTSGSFKNVRIWKKIVKKLNPFLVISLKKEYSHIIRSLWLAGTNLLQRINQLSYVPPDYFSMPVYGILLTRNLLMSCCFYC